MGIVMFDNFGMLALTPMVHASMRSPPAKQMQPPMWAMTVAFTLNYLAVGVAGAFLFHGHVASNASLNLDETKPWHCAAVFFYTVQLSASFLLCFFQVADTVAEERSFHTFALLIPSLRFL